jgi:uncharacterized protein YpbB
MHPLAGDLSNLKDSEIEAKVNDLTKKYFMTPNTGVKAQMAAMLDTLNEELGRRRKASYDKAMAARNKDLDSLIKIN